MAYADSVLRMRRLGPAVLCLSLLVAAAACADSKSGSSPITGVPDTAASLPDTADSVPGSADTTPVSIVDKPTVSLPKVLPTTLVITDLSPGTGPKAAVGDTVVVHYIGVLSASGEEFDSNFDSATGFDVQLGSNRVIQGWEQGLLGAQQGGRRQLDIPASLAYGDSPPSGSPIQAGDALTFVVDVIVVLPTSKATDDPGVTLKAAKNVGTMVSTELIEGTGAGVQDGQTVALRIVSYRADTGALLASSWGEPPLTFVFSATTDVYPGLVEAVRGMKVGGRRQAQVPFASVFNGAGSTNLGLPASVDLVVVLDLVTVY
ncbi:MAG: hypothetical protein F2681_07950 [Actinobacteria bacterium]|uniref:peptidylprolyl isomerase n=1 Tax=freshwater metagenome TaxID=449393 RepID=A0A6J7C514_9ZZZZ|nr:hypothetical protein [Actinomycetota bacterium]MSW77071.1 hypothetical protein [Actinomycetota bacterium]MSX56569.1 hypothetical protein [Actinomycetota bacterium]MSX92582.1 hypothetical protein [Actinomycetota bacterium]MSZ83061.1 hypothetical protein [Actinomycetota bacterium]